MPKSLHVRNLDEDLVRKLKIRAARNGRSAEAEHREILRGALAAEEGADLDKRAVELRERLEGRRLTPSIELLREGRDER